MHFRSAERGVFADYPMQPYSNTMYAGPADEVLVLFKGAESEGFYEDAGGYGWYYNGDTNKSIDMVFAPAGGQRISYYVTDPNYSTIFNKVVKGKKPVTKETAKATAEKSAGKETSGKAVASSSASGSTQEKRATTSAGGTPSSGGGTGGGGEDDGKKLWEKPWFLPAVGAVTLVTVATIALWPTKKATPVRTNGKKRRSTRKRSR